MRFPYLTAAQRAAILRCGADPAWFHLTGEDATTIYLVGKATGNEVTVPKD